MNHPDNGASIHMNTFFPTGNESSTEAKRAVGPGHVDGVVAVVGGGVGEAGDALAEALEVGVGRLSDGSAGIVAGVNVLAVPNPILSARISDDESRFSWLEHAISVAAGRCRPGTVQRLLIPRQRRQRSAIGKWKHWRRSGEWFRRRPDNRVSRSKYHRSDHRKHRGPTGTAAAAGSAGLLLSGAAHGVASDHLGSRSGRRRHCPGRGAAGQGKCHRLRPIDARGHQTNRD